MPRAGNPCFCAACLLTLIAIPAPADEVVLHRGTTVTGRILEENSAGLRIDTMISGVRATLHFARAEIRDVIPGPVPDSFFDPPPVRPSVPSSPPASRDPKAPNTVAPLIRAAEQGDTAAMWSLVDMYERGDGVPKNPSRANSWLRRLCHSGDGTAHARLATQDPDMYAALCRRVKVGTQLRPGEAVELTGIVQPTPGSLIVLASSTGSEARTRVDRSSISLPAAAKVGRAVTVRGLVQSDGTLAALWSEVPPPEYAYRHSLKEQGVVGGRDQTWVVRLTVTNTGKQPIKSMNFDVRCYQIDSPNEGNPSRTVTVRDLKAGESRPVEVRFNLYNYQYIGRTSMPRVEVDPGQPEW